MTYLDLSSRTNHLVKLDLLEFSIIKYLVLIDLFRFSISHLISNPSWPIRASICIFDIWSTMTCYDFHHLPSVHFSMIHLDFFSHLCQMSDTLWLAWASYQVFDLPWLIWSLFLMSSVKYALIHLDFSTCQFLIGLLIVKCPIIVTYLDFSFNRQGRLHQNLHLLTISLFNQQIEFGHPWLTISRILLDYQHIFLKYQNLIRA